MRVRAALLVLVAVLAAQASMQQDDAPVTLRSETRVVQIDVSVQDSQGRPVENLKASDFAIIDNGKPRSFSIFSPNFGTQSDGPKDQPRQPTLPPNVFTNTGAAAMPPDGHSTIILLDGENGWFENSAYAREGVLKLLPKLPADEKIAVYALMNGKGMGILQDYTLDRSQVKAALAKFISPIPDRRPDAMRVASEDVRVALNALAEKLRSVPGRKNIFWVTQGFLPSELRDLKNKWDKTIAALNDANVAVNAVDSNGLLGPRPRWGPGQIFSLQQIAEATGGQAYHNRNDIDGAIASGIAASRSSYTLGFYLTEMDGKFHELKVNVNRSNLQLNYRQGYYAQTDAVKDKSGKQPELHAALLSPSPLTDVGITATLHIIPGKPRGTLDTRLALDSEPLSMKRTGDGYSGKVEELFLEFDAAGHEVGRYSDFKEITVKADNKAEFDTQGAILSQAIPLEAKAVKVSIIVRDTASGRIGSLIIPLGKITSSVE